MPIEITQHLVAQSGPRERPYELRDSVQPGLILRVQPSGVKRYYAEVARGKRVVLGPAPAVTPKQARNLAKSKIGAHVDGKDVSRKRGRKAQTTLRAFLEGDYWDHHLRHRKSGKATQSRILAAWAPFLDKDMGDLDAAKIAEHRSKRQAAGVLPQTLNRDRTTLLSLLNNAAERAILEANPLAGAALKQLQTADDRRVRWLGQRDELEDIRDPDTGTKVGERERFLQALEHAPDYLRQMALLVLNTGLRRGEVFDLRWEHVSIERRTLTVHASTAKTSKTRHVPLNDEAAAVLQELADDKHETGLVFVNKKTEARYDTVKKSWATLVKRARLHDFHFHDCRHDFASRLVQAGVDLYVVRDLLGHSSLQLTERYA
ncbi:MAG TPA: site-specific integrase, partial [Gammaproteobacteria bacterium]|nr:site-specific integrase [Gammaproteobacteria bacterium]